VISLWDQDGNLLATNDDPIIETDYGFFYDTGILYRWTFEDSDGDGQVDDTNYYLTVEDSAGAYGTGTFYPGVGMWYYDTLAVWEEESGLPLGDGGVLEFDESSNTDGYYYARAAGHLDSDDTDSFRLIGGEVDGLDGKYVNVTLDSEIYGSLLDAKLVLYDAERTVLIEETTSSLAGEDPAIVNYEVDGVDSLYVSVEAESGDDLETANSYFMIVTVYDQES
ncbi:MAG: hypothetical protein QGG40_18110, partial [Myxococcota bacterium]|nr:hypothetical protein [Myxococcota bacterium]